PRILTSKQENISYEELFEFTSFEEVIRSIIEKKVARLGFEGFKKISDWAKNKGIPIVVSDTDFPAVVELIACRNIIAHNRCIVDERYLEMVANSRFKLGERRTINLNELFPGFIILGKVVLETDFSAAKTFGLSYAGLTAPDQKTGS